jgi:chromate reductase
MKIIGISGSLRNDSYNTKVLSYAGTLMEGVDFEIINIETPLYNEDLKISEELVNTQEKLSKADAILIVTPEYNHSVTGVLKNFIDWMSVEPHYPFDDKKVAIMSASMGMLGGARAQFHLRQILTGMGANVIASHEVFVASVHEKFDGETLVDEKTKKNVKKMVDLLVDSHN